MRTIAITLPENPFRREEAAQHFRERGLFVEWMLGVNAEKFGLFTTHPYLKDDPVRGGHIIPQRQVGCMLSHYMAWTVCNSLPDEAVMIVEDDADFPEDWIERLKAALDNTPEDADILYVGNCNCADKQKEQIAGEVFDVKYPLCTHAYIVWKKAIPLLLRTQRDAFAPVDISLYYNSLPQLNAYSVLPRIISQRGTPLSP